MEEIIKILEREENAVKAQLANVISELEYARALHKQKERLEDKLQNIQTAKNRLQFVVEEETKAVNEQTVEDAWGGLELVK